MFSDVASPSRCIVSGMERELRRTRVRRLIFGELGVCELLSVPKVTLKLLQSSGASLTMDRQVEHTCVRRKATNVRQDICVVFTTSSKIKRQTSAEMSRQLRWFDLNLTLFDILEHGGPPGGSPVSAG